MIDYLLCISIYLTEQEMKKMKNSTLDGTTPQVDKTK